MLTRMQVACDANMVMWCDVKTSVPVDNVSKALNTIWGET